MDFYQAVVDGLKKFMPEPEAQAKALAACNASGCGRKESYDKDEMVKILNALQKQGGFSEFVSNMLRIQATLGK